MATKKEIKERLIATSKTKKITQAMSTVSTSKFKKVESSLKQFRQVSAAVDSVVSSLVLQKGLSHPALEANKARPCYILITSDRGLIGAYNNALFKFFDEYVKEHHKSKDEFMVATIGFKAYIFAKHSGYNLLNKENVSIRDDILFIDFNSLSKDLYKAYIDGKIGKTRVFYTSFINSLETKIKEKRILPYKVKKGFDLNNIEYLFEPSKEEVLDSAIELSLEYSFYRILLEAKASEHASRMNAMKNATDNATEIEERLAKLYNHARQNQITTELIDIVNGANSK